ncbi:NAD(P)/FAD-dependent oxidoreductase [Psychroflexus sediminis]|uniref:Pyridine nucleotide-disulphide oxidoreductase n=1 Tax=Psychroflexus sediminis TaxID=470826 RepID=A0A1G7UFY6_9FLAO|nr:FAD/NAD(P)-binding oxidoreductase [Psychroflexus sediminis]SDG46475.1 Pyridine nucleotide-disulphide oxidoreductase [Psychroflexus sediminis]
MKQEHIVIIGNGISGVTLARHIRKLSDKRITLISSESDYFFSRTALMYVYMGHMKWNHLKPYEDTFWEKNRLELKQAHVTHVDTEHKQLKLDSGEDFSYDKLVIACGSRYNKFGWPGQDAEAVIGLVSKQDLEQLEVYAPNNNVCKRAVIVGGGLIGVELAEMLSTRNIPVTFLVREEHFWNTVIPDEEAQVLERHIREHGIDLRLGNSLEEIITDEHRRAKAVKVKETGEIIDCDLVGLTPGVSPNIDFLKSSKIELNRGVLVNRMLETSEPDVYAIGDCAEQREPIGNRPPVEAVWYTGRMMGETLAQTLCGNPMEYNPGHWFNSAKFFDIEYQTYGWVFPTPKEGHDDFYWEAEDGKKCIHIHFEKEPRIFKGINTFGIRMRHEVFDYWLTEEATVEEVIKNLKKANFDPEFFEAYEKQIQKEFEKEFNTIEL